jgi:sulfur-carrier protein adenylyltransferase/sulfurtransferase
MPVPFEITVQELKEMRDSGTPHRLIDCREPDEFAKSNIGGELMPMNSIPARLQDLDPDDDIIVYCKVGGRSAMVVEYLRRNGFEKARNLQGGILAWAEKIDTSIKV